MREELRQALDAHCAGWEAAIARQEDHSSFADPAPPAPEPSSIRATCDMPGPDTVSVGPGHLRVRGWALS